MTTMNHTDHHTNHINVSIDAATNAWLRSLAEHSHISVEDLARQKLQEALERDEDIYFSRLAMSREDEKIIPHDQVW